MSETEPTLQPAPQVLPQKNRKRKVSVYLPEEWVAELERIAAERGTTVSAIVRDLVYEFLRSVRR